MGDGNILQSVHLFQQILKLTKQAQKKMSKNNIYNKKKSNQRIFITKGLKFRK